MTRNRVVLVTGAGSGIGAVTAARFAAAGDTVVVADIAADKAATVAATLPGAVPVGLDVTDERAVTAAITQLRQQVSVIDVLVNNAAVAGDEPFETIDKLAWDRDIAVSLTGGFLMSQAVLPAMIAAGGGSIVNVASVNALLAVGNEAYSAAKAGLLSLTRSLAVRYGPDGVRVNAVVPGTIATPIWRERIADRPETLQRLTRWYPLGRVGRPEDVAAAVTFLAGDEAGWITGVALPVDGGLLAGNAPMAQDILGR